MDGISFNPWRTMVHNTHSDLFHSQLFHIIDHTMGKTSENYLLLMHSIPEEDEIKCFAVKKCFDKDPKKEQAGIKAHSLQATAGHSTIQKHDFQVQTSLVGDHLGGEELVSVFVRTSQQLQEMLQCYESKVNQTTKHISCLQDHIRLLHDQLSHKERTIFRMCDRYISLCKEKQSSEEHLQRQIDELTAVVDACSRNHTSQLQRLLIQQVSRNRHLEYQNENLSQQIIMLSRQEIGRHNNEPEKDDHT